MGEIKLKSEQAALFDGFVVAQVGEAGPVVGGGGAEAVGAGAGEVFGAADGVDGPGLQLVGREVGLGDFGDAFVGGFGVEPVGFRGGGEEEGHAGIVRGAVVYFGHEAVGFGGEEDEGAEGVAVGGGPGFGVGVKSGEEEGVPALLLYEIGHGMFPAVDVAAFEDATNGDETALVSVAVPGGFGVGAEFVAAGVEHVGAELRDLCFGAEGVGDEAPLHFFEGVSVVLEDQHGVVREGRSCGEFKCCQFFVGPFGLEVREEFLEVVVFGFEGDVVTHGVKFGKMGEMGGNNGLHSGYFGLAQKSIN